LESSLVENLHHWIKTKKMSKEEEEQRRRRIEERIEEERIGGEDEIGEKVRGEERRK
jgi:hypothetical protein